MTKLRRPMYPVAVSRAELLALLAAWRHFLNSDVADIDPLRDAIHRLHRRLAEEYPPTNLRSTNQ